MRALDGVLEEAKKSVEPSHSHPEGIKREQTVAAAVFLVRSKKAKDEIRSYIEDTLLPIRHLQLT